MSNNILDSFKCNELGNLKNRIVMSAMTRHFADDNHCCTDLIRDYYVRRAENDVAVIVTEGIVIHPSADGYKNVPHIYTKEQADSWRETIEKVHNAGSKIIAQLWHCGRISHKDFTGGIDPVSSTNNAAEGINRQNNQPFGKPRALLEEEIPSIIEMYEEATKKSLEVGFDAVEIHMGHGYLIDQFFDARVNDRTDKYGGSVENRCRLALEIIERLIEKFGAEKIIIRISPSRYMNEIYEWHNLDEMLAYFINEVNKIGLTMLDISCANAVYEETSGKVIEKIRKLGWDKIIIGGASLSQLEANEEINKNNLDLVTWGRAILANPDFPIKLKDGKELVAFNNEMRDTLY